MRVFGLAFAGLVALTIPMAAHALPFGSNLAPAAPSAAPNIVQVWGGCGWGWHPVPGHWSQWRGGRCGGRPYHYATAATITLI